MMPNAAKNWAYQITIPYPPSVNSYWRNVRGMTLISKAGREYREKVKALVGTFPWVENMKGAISMEISAWMPDARRRDIDNILKAPLDALEHAGVYENDNQVEELIVRKAGIKRGGELVITISEI